MSKKIPSSDLKSFHQCFKCIYDINFIFGVLIFYVKGKDLQMTYYSKIYARVMRIVLLAIFVGGFIVKLNDNQLTGDMLNHLSPLLKFIMVLECISCMINYIFTALTLDLQTRTHMKLAERFRQLDECMLTDFPQISWNYPKTVRKYRNLTMFVCSFYIVFSMIFLFTIMRSKSGIISSFMIAISYTIITFATGSVAFMHIGLLDILRLRYRLIRRMLKHYNSIENAYTSVYRLSIYTRRYTELILEVNDVFSIAIASGIFNDFVMLTSLVYLICQRIFVGSSKPYEYIFVILFMAPRLYKVLASPMYGKVMENERKRCVHDIAIYGEDFKEFSHIKNLFRPFLHWKVQHNYKVTIGKVIPCSLNILFMVLNGIANYVLILIQLQFQQTSIENRVKSSHDSRRNVE